jgi:hypothetical protein
VLQKAHTATTNASGTATMSLFPNALTTDEPAGLGETGSTYTFIAAVAGGKKWEVRARVPNQACNLHDIVIDEASDADAAAARALAGSVRYNLAQALTSPQQAQARSNIGAQASDGDLTAIASLTPSNDDFVQRKEGAWANRTVAQVKSDLAINNVDNTSDADKPVSTAQQAALELKVALTALAATSGGGLVGTADGGTIATYIKDKANRVVDTIAALKALDKTKYTRAFVLGYSAAGDGGGGPYYYDSADTTSSDNGGTIIVASDSGRWKLLHNNVVTVTQFGALGSGSNEHTLIQAALDAGVTTVKFGPVAYKIGAPLTCSSDQIWEGIAGKTILETNALTYLITATGTISGDLTNTLASNALTSANSVTLAAGKGANFAAGDLVVLQSEAAMPYTAITGKRAEFHLVESISTDTLTFAGLLSFDFNTADTALVRKVTPISELTIRNITLRCTDTTNYRRALTELKWCRNLKLENVVVEGTPSPAIQLYGCYDTEINNIRGYNLLSDDATDFGYVITELGINKGLRVNGGSGDRVRHFYTTGGWAAFGYGTPMGSQINGATALNCRRAGFDTHEDGIDIAFNDCTVVGSAASGGQARCVRNKFNNFRVINCVGEAVYVDSSAQSTEINDLTSKNTNKGTYSAVSRIERGAIFDNGVGTIVKGGRIEDCGGPAIESYDSARKMTYENVTIRNACQSAATNTSAVLIAPDTVTTAAVNGLDIENTDTKMAYGVRCTRNNTVVNGSNLRIVGAQTSKTNYNVGCLEVDGISRKSYGKAAAATVIASGVLDITNHTGPMIVVGGEGGLADNLVTITGGSEGDTIILVRTSQAITIEHATGNILLASGANKAMNSASVIKLVRRSTFWVQPGY